MGTIITSQSYAGLCNALREMVTVRLLFFLGEPSRANLEQLFSSAGIDPATESGAAL